MSAFAGNRIRGLLGAGMHRNLPESEYARWFAPEADSGPSGLRNLPRPFVLRAWHLNGRNFAPGEAFTFDVHFFADDKGLRIAFHEAANEIGAVSRIDLRNVTVPLQPAPAPVQRLRLAFLTPTELKTAGRLAERPDFGILLSRLRDRISTLTALYGEGPLPVDFEEFGKRASRVRLEEWRGEWLDYQRRSKRSGEVHPLGGLVGAAEYTDVPGEFLPFLDAGFYTGVGRQTTWGKGVIRRTMLEV